MIGLVVITVLLLAVEGAPQSRLVYPRLLEERSSDGRMVLHLHDDLTLNLRKTSVAAREFRVLENVDGHDLTHFFKGEEIDRNLHEDERQFATVHVIKKESGVHVEGIVGPEHRIQPMPEMKRSDEGFIAHMIYKIERNKMLDIEVAPRGKVARVVDERSNNVKNAPVPAQVKIELFVVSDSPHFSFFKATMQLIQYLCVLVNSINLRYADTSDPKVQFLLVGVEKDQHGTYRKGSGNYMDSEPTLDAFKEYANEKKHAFGDPDVVYLMTGSDTYNSGPNNTIDTNALGLGFVGGLCTNYFVALGEDTAGMYNGMHTMAHEAGHLLGASHDESDPKTWIKGDPGSKSCKWAEGHLMSYVDGGPKHHRFSGCSLAQIRNVVILRGMACWEVNNKGHQDVGKYAGMFVDPDEYCRKLVYPHKKNVTADMKSTHAAKCKLKCQYPEYHEECEDTRCYTYVTTYYRLLPSLDFMVCGNDRVCIRGVCTPMKDIATKHLERPKEVPTTDGVTQAPETEPPKTKPAPTPTDGEDCQCDCSTSTAAITSTTESQSWWRRKFGR
uniref:Peptidase M12B domain-containing protein n=1 Tax=Amblyomma maculatum TaxID=34609 RepID=G3MNQ2_AMBMU